MKSKQVIIWLCNTLVPEAAEYFGVRSSKPESWISAVYNDIKNNADISLVYLFPTRGDCKEAELDGVNFISYSEHNPNSYYEIQVEEFRRLLEKNKPSVIHIFGTEMPHSYAMTKACEEAGLIDHLVVSIQGLVSIYAKHYTAYLPYDVVKKRTVRDLIKKDSILKQKDGFIQRGQYEEMTLRMVKHVIGRTEWDRVCVERINTSVHYYHCNETLRKAFYGNRWNSEKAEKHTVFLSQWYSPIKGLHLLLEAVGELVTEYPDLKIFTTGDSFIPTNWKEKLKLSEYKKYCLGLIKQYGLEGKIEFLGYLNEEEMCKTFLRSNVFICPSSIENSPNSVGEAMLLGMPIVAADVGGMKSILKENEGFLYPADAPYMMAYFMRQVFDGNVEKMCLKAREHALQTHDPEKNMDTLLSIYNEIGKM